MNNPIKKILITGSSGTIGTRLCEKLLEKGYEVVGVDWRANKWNKEVEELTLRGDLREISTFDKIPSGIDLVVHLAANARVYNLVKDPRLARDNFETTFNTLDFARRSNIKRFIFASSREVYGNSEKVIHCEDEAYVRNCESPYTASKVGGEALVHAYWQCYGIDFVIARFSNVYGMYDDSDRIIPLFIRLAKEGKDLVVFGKAKLLDFTYIDDCVAGILKCIENFTEIKNDVYNIASGKAISILEVAQILQNIMQSSSQIILAENRTGEVVQFSADISKARRVLGYEPQNTITQGVQKAVLWYVENV